MARAKIGVAARSKDEDKKAAGWFDGTHAVAGLDQKGAAAPLLRLVLREAAPPPVLPTPLLLALAPAPAPSAAGSARRAARVRMGRSCGMGTSCSAAPAAATGAEPAETGSGVAGAGAGVGAGAGAGAARGEATWVPASEGVCRRESSAA